MGAYGAFGADSTAGDSTITVNGGSDGGPGRLFFTQASSGGTARIALVDGGIMDVVHHDERQEVSIGSLEGNGDVFLRENTLIVGNNDLTRTFSGRIRHRAERIGAKGIPKKVGKGSLTLSGANTYTGGTIIIRGALLVDNPDASATSSGPVEVRGGSLGGTGIIAGTVTVGPGNRATGTSNRFHSRYSCYSVSASL